MRDFNSLTNIVANFISWENTEERTKLQGLNLNTQKQNQTKLFSDIVFTYMTSKILSDLQKMLFFFFDNHGYHYIIISL